MKNNFTTFITIGVALNGVSLDAMCARYANNGQIAAQRKQKLKITESFGSLMIAVMQKTVDCRPSGAHWQSLSGKLSQLSAPFAV